MKKPIFSLIVSVVTLYMILSGCRQDDDLDDSLNNISSPSDSGSGFIIETQNNSANITGVPTNTTEAGGGTTFTVKLARRPLADVLIPISSSDISEGAVSPASLTFTTDNWNVDQTVTVTGVDDDIQDGNQSYQTDLGLTTSADTDYNGITVGTVSITNIDDDNAGFHLSAVNGNTSEYGGTATFTVKLTSQPLSDVSVDVTSSNIWEGTISPSSLTFTNSNWDTGQFVTIMGVNDSLIDLDQNYSVVFSAADSTDDNYNGIQPGGVSVTNLDNEMPLLPDTNQTTSYAVTFGEDNDYTVNSPSHTDNGNGTATDNNTGLKWQRQDDDQQYIWIEAVEYCQNLDLGARSDWRLPSIKELESIGDFGRRDPTINTSIFLNTKSSEYWTSTTYAGNANQAWSINFETLQISPKNKSSAYYVRCVLGNVRSDLWPHNFVVVGDGTVVHPSTGLTWQQVGPAYIYNEEWFDTWEAALSYCEDLSLGGKSDWRLPSFNELISIVDYSINSPAINIAVFPDAGFPFWSSTTSMVYAGGNFAAQMNLWTGGMTSWGNYNDVGAGMVRCVRGGP